jgi:hypothetical protein
MNQCDGCRRELPLEGDIHVGEGYDMIACTASRYKDIARGRIWAKSKLTHEEYFGGVIFTPEQNVKIGTVLLEVFGDYKCGVPMTCTGTWGFKQWAKWITSDERW